MKIRSSPLATGHWPLATEAPLAVASGTLLVLVFPRFGWNWMAPVALVPLLLALHGETAGRRFWLGHLAGCVYWGGACYWIYGVMHEYGHVPAAGAAALLVGFFLVKALHLGVFACLAGPLLARWWAIPAVAALWTALEGTHPYAGFTWLMLGHAAVDLSLVARLAPLTGVLGMSFVLMMMNTGVALALRWWPRRHLAPLAALLLLYLAPRLPVTSPGQRTAWLVQPNIDAADASASNPLTRWRVAGANRTPDLILWPENPAPAYFYDDAEFRQAVEQVARTHGTYLLFSAVAFRGRARKEPLNSAVLLGPAGEEIARYDKIHLVPFGEFVPWPFGRLVEKVTSEAGDFVPGDKVVVAPAGGHAIGTFICYESVFGNGVRQFVAGGAEVLVNLSNDGWYGRTAARDQHLLIARSRAQENARWLLRATNTGLTRVIDPAGRMTAAIPPDQPDMLIAGFDYVTRQTVYTRWGDWFWWTTIAASLAALWQARKREHAGRT